jgi:hypothetical protein
MNAASFLLLVILAASIAHAEPLASQATSTASSAASTAPIETPLLSVQKTESPAVSNIVSKPVNAPAPMSSGPSPPSSFDSALDTLEKILKVLAYFVGGAWVYFNYFQGRTYKARLEVKLSGVKLETDTSSLAKITAQVKNVGLSKCELLDRGSGLRLQGYDATKQVDQWTPVGTFPMLTQNNQWIEPGVTIEEQILLPIDMGKFVAFRAELILNSLDEDVRWKMVAIF